jgi:hypothetical protein
MTHGAKLEHRELALSTSNAALAEEHGPVRVDPDRKCDQRDEWEHQQQ